MNSDSIDKTKKDKRYDRLTEKIVASYTTLGIINTGNVRLPSFQQIDKNLNRFKEILFPGFRGNLSETEMSNLSTTTTQRLEQLSHTLSHSILACLNWDNNDKATQEHADSITMALLNKIPQLRESLLKDAEALFKGDPAAKSLLEIVFSYPGFQAIMVYRIAHELYLKKVPLIPRMMSEIVHSDTGIDIHPGATVGHSFCIDHGTGIVIGETAKIGNHVKLYQGVTLGAFSVEKSKCSNQRHPTLKDHVTVYARSTILGGNTIIGKNCIVGGNVWLIESMPDNTTIYVSMGDKQVLKQRQSLQ